MNLLRFFFFSGLFFFPIMGLSLDPVVNPLPGVDELDCTLGFPSLPKDAQNIVFKNVNGLDKYHDKENALVYVESAISWFANYDKKIAIWDIDQTLLTGGKLTRPVYRKITETFSLLKANGWKIIAITVRKYSRETAYATFQDLESVGLSPWFFLEHRQESLNLETYIESDFRGEHLGHGVSRVGNVIFTSSGEIQGDWPENNRDKGLALLHYLRARGERPQAIIFTDDGHSHTVEISNYCRINHIQSLALQVSDACVELGNSSARAGSNRVFNLIPKDKKHVFIRVNDGEDMMFEIKMFLNNINDNRDPSSKCAEQRLLALFDMDDTIISGRKINDGAALLYPEMPNSIASLREANFVPVIVTDRDISLLGITCRELEENQLLQHFPRTEFKPLRNGLMSESFIFSSCKITPDNGDNPQSAANILFAHLRQLQNEQRFTAARRLIQAYGATKAFMLGQYLETYAVGCEQVVVYLEDSQADCQEVFDYCEDKGIPCLVMLSTKADKNRLRDLKIMMRQQQAAPAVSALSEDDDLL